MKERTSLLTTTGCAWESNLEIITFDFKGKTNLISSYFDN
jgi:hypothetical protein